MKLLLFILLLCGTVLGQSTESNPPLKEKEEKEVYHGYWRFVKEDFRKRHPFLLRFLVRKALNTRLYLGEDFIQYETPEKMIGEPRPIKKTEEVEDNHFVFHRKEGDELVKFELFKKGEKWYFREGDLFYQLLKDNEEDQRIWRDQK